MTSLRDRDDIVRRRLRAQRLIGKPFAKPGEVVAWHLAMQSQDYAGAKWAVGQRCAHASDRSVEAAVAGGEILRTHVLRPTWHFVAPADVRWLLQLTAPRISAQSAPYFRRHGLDAQALRRSRRVLEKQLADRRLTREQLAPALAAAGLPTAGEALSYQLLAAELAGVIVSGGRSGKHHLYALLDQIVPAAAKKPRDEALAELALRYLQGHGPALVQDLAWWAGLTIADAKRGVAAAGPALQSAVVDERQYWFAGPARGVLLREPAVHLLPNYDEQLIAYRYRGNAVDAATSARVGRGDGIFDGHFLLIDGKLVGSYRREQSKTRALLTVTHLRALTRAEQRALRVQAERHAAFLELELELSLQRR